jgi:hypothetical protein
MSKNKGTAQKGSVTKRQATREKRRQQQRRQRLLIILGIGVFALVIAGILIIPSLAPVGDIVEITPTTRPMVAGRALGDPNAPVLVEVYSDFQCPACRTFASEVEPRLVDTYVPSGKVQYIYRFLPFLDNRVLTKESDQPPMPACAPTTRGDFGITTISFCQLERRESGAFSDKRLVAMAESLGLDMNAFNQCFKASRLFPRSSRR